MAETCAKAACHLSERFRLPFSKTNWSGLSGSWKGSGTGNSIDFQEHREYKPGDDPRHINWQAYGRTGEYVMKVYREEVTPKLDLLIDVSNSMFGIDKKALITQVLLNFCRESALTNGAICHIWALNGNKTCRIELSECEGGNLPLGPSKDGLLDSIDRVELRPDSLRVLISDLLFLGDPQKIISSLCRSRGRLFIFAPADPSEFAPEWSGDMDLINIESGELIQSYIGEKTMFSYQQAYQRHFLMWNDTADKNHVGFGIFYSHQALAFQFEKTGLRKGLVEAAL